MGAKYLLGNLTVVTGAAAGRGCIAVSGEHISGVWIEDGEGRVRYGGEDIPLPALAARFSTDNPDAEILDFAGMYAFAGGIDAHVHFREPGMTGKADMESESLAAVLGGVTSYIDMPNTNPPTVTARRLSEKLAMAEGRSWGNYGFHLGATNSNIDEINDILAGKELIGPDSFGGIKVFMGSSTGNMLVDDESTLSSLFRIRRKEILVHSEDEGIIRRNMQAAADRYGEDIPFSEHVSIRSRQACIRSTIKALELAMKYGTRLHVLHVSTKEEVEMIRAAKALNPDITAETSANYLWFCADDYDRMGSHLKCNPSVKTAEDRAALRAALGSGLIDTIGSDHAPHLAEEKDRKYMCAPSGLPSIRQTLPVLLTIASEEEIPLTRIASVFSEKAAAMFGIRDRGVLREGSKADIVIVSPEEQTITNTESGYRCGWTPYEGAVLKWSVKEVLVNGCRRVTGGKVTGCPNGQRLSFDR